MNKPQLFCFSFAGGTASFFDELEKDLPELELIKVEYPGHGTRFREAFAADFEALADDAFRQVKKQYLKGTYGLLGYSMGSITLVEVLKRILANSTMQKPEHVFLAAHEPHSKTELSGFTTDKLDDWIKKRTLLFGGIPDRLINNQTFWRMYLPLYRTDYALIQRYRFEELDLKTEIPATIFYSETDTPRSEMQKWKRYFIGKCEYHCYVGKHFFIREYHKEMAGVILSGMKKGGNHDT